MKVLVVGALSVGGGFLLADVGREELRAGRTAAQLVNVVTTGGKPPPGATVASILGQASQVATETGMSKADLVGAALSYAQHAKGGDFKGAMSNMAFFAKMSQVTGADIGELAKGAGTLQSQNPDLGTMGMRQMFLDIYAQGKMGSMSMEDVGKQLGTLGSQRSAFTGDVTRNQRELMALGQIVAPGGSIEEAGVFTKDVAQEALKKHKKLEALGVRYRGGQVDMSPAELVAQVFKGAHGNLGAIEDIFEGRGSKVFGELKGTYDKAGGGDKGVAAVRGAMAAVTGATMTEGQFNAQHAQTMSQPIEKLSVAFEKLKDDVAGELTPWIEKFTDNLPALTGHVSTLIAALGAFATTIVNNPVPAALVLLAKQMGGVPGELAAALAAGVAAIDWAAAADRATQRQRAAADIGTLNTALELGGKTRAGTVTVEDMRKAESVLAEARGRASEKPGFGEAYLDSLTQRPVREALGLTTGREDQEARAKKLTADNADLLARALQNAAKKIDAISFKDPSRHTDIAARHP